MPYIWFLGLSLPLHGLFLWSYDFRTPIRAHNRLSNDYRAEYETTLAIPYDFRLSL
nr:MAG TPA: hypothetical protein [Caudoviricetes sp.]